MAAIKAATDAEGVTRNQWIARLIERELDTAASPPSPSPPRRRRGGEKKFVALRIDAADRDAVDRAAARLGMRRSQWIARRIRGGISTAAESVLPSRETHLQAAEAIAQIVRIGRNVNQAVRAVNASILPESGLDLRRCTDHLTAMRDDIWQAIDHAEDRLLALARGEQKYWRDDHA